MATVVIVISFLVCIHRTSASTPETISLMSTSASSFVATEQDNSSMMTTPFESVFIRDNASLVLPESTQNASRVDYTEDYVFVTLETSDVFIMTTPEVTPMPTPTVFASTTIPTWETSNYNDSNTSIFLSPTPPLTLPTPFPSTKLHVSSSTIEPSSHEQPRTHSARNASDTFVDVFVSSIQSSDVRTTFPVTAMPTYLPNISQSSIPSNASVMSTHPTDTLQKSEDSVLPFQTITLHTGLLSSTNTLYGISETADLDSKTLSLTPSVHLSTISQNNSTSEFLSPSKATATSFNPGVNLASSYVHFASEAPVISSEVPILRTELVMSSSIKLNSTTEFLSPSKATTTSFNPGMNLTASYVHSTSKIPIVSSEVPILRTVPVMSSSILSIYSDNIVFSITPSMSAEIMSSTAETMLPGVFDLTTALMVAESSASPIDFVPVRCTLVLAGNCAPVSEDNAAFSEVFINSISSMISINPSRVTVNNVACGSVVVDFTLEDTAEGDFAEHLYNLIDTGAINIPFQGQNMTAESVVFHSGPYADASSKIPDSNPEPPSNPPISDGDGGGLSFEDQQKLIYILISVIVGFVILIAIVLVVHHALRRICNRSTQSFDLHEEPCIKLTDFNMAHTTIPRPRSIYSSIGADGKFFRYDSQEDGVNPPGSPTSFMYANSDEIKEHYHEVIDPEAHVITDFGRSGLPEWNLPLIDGAPPVSSVGPDLLTTVESHHSSKPSTSSDTFQAPSSASSTLNNPPIFTPPAPPPPPPPPLPTPIPHSGTLQSRQSGDASSEMTDSSGDTNTLTRGSSDPGTSMMGIDNPLMTPEEDYDDIGPSTSNRMSRYIVH